MQGRGKLDFGVHTLAKGACHILELSIFYLAPPKWTAIVQFCTNAKDNTSLY